MFQHRLVEDVACDHSELTCGHEVTPVAGVPRLLQGEVPCRWPWAQKIRPHTTMARKQERMAFVPCRRFRNAAAKSEPYRLARLGFSCLRRQRVVPPGSF